MDSFNECKELLSHGLKPCYGDSDLEIARLIEVGGLVKCISLTIPKVQQRDLRASWMAWAGGAVDDGKLNVRSKYKQRRKYCVRKWNSFQPTTTHQEEEIAFIDSRGVPLRVPLLLVDILSTTILRPSSNLELKAVQGATIDATLKIGDHVGLVSGPNSFEVVAMEGSQIEARSLDGSGDAFRLYVSDLSGRDVIRVKAVATIDGDKVTPAFFLPVPDAADAIECLRALKQMDEEAQVQQPLQAAKVQEHGRLLDAMRAREVRNRSEAIRYLGLIHTSRALEVSSWEQVGRCLCMASPDLAEQWTAWTESHGNKTYPSIRARRKELEPAGACSERWKFLFRPPTHIDFANSDNATHQLQFMDPTNNCALRVRAMVVADPEPTHHVLTSLPLSLEITETLSNIQQGDFVSCRSRVAFRFARVMKLDINSASPSITVLRTQGFGGNQVLEVWDDLGLLWNCWVWRPQCKSELRAESLEKDGQKQADARAMVEEDDLKAVQEKEEQLLTQIKNAEIANAYYAPHFIRPVRTAALSPPKVVLVKRSEKELLIGWKQKSSQPTGEDAIVEILCKGKPNGQMTLPFNGSNIVAPVWKEQSLIGGVYTSSNVEVSPDPLPSTNGWSEIYRGSQNGCLVTKLKSGRTYSFRVRIGEIGAYAHRRLSTLPSAPPPPLIKAWLPVPTPNKSPKPSRERILELVLCGPEEWYRNLSFRNPEKFRQPAESEDTPQSGKAKSSGAFGSSSNRFNGLAAGAQNGGGMHSRRVGSEQKSRGLHVVGSLLKKNETTKKASVLPHGWTYVVEMQLLSEETVLLMEEELDDVLGGNSEDFFFRHPLPEVVREKDEDTMKKKTKRKDVPDEEVMVKAWKEVIRTRGLVAHVHNLVASPPLIGSRRIGRKVSVDEQGWSATAREVQMRKNRERFESGYLFVPTSERLIEGHEIETKQSIEGKTLMGTTLSTLHTSNKPRRKLYVFRTRIENMRDPSIKSEFSSYLLCEAPYVFSEVSVKIPQPVPSLNCRPFSEMIGEASVSLNSFNSTNKSEEPREEFEVFLESMKSLLQTNDVQTGQSNTATALKHDENDDKHYDNRGVNDEVEEAEELRLASEWTEYWDEDKKRPYFYHHPTSTVQWLPPTVWHGRALETHNLSDRPKTNSIVD